MTKKALIRLEDMGPFKHYTSEENIKKLWIIADYLQSEGVPFHIAVIPRVVDPRNNYDKSIADNDDPSAVRFKDLMKYFIGHGAALCIHGYTHQYGLSVSAVGFEFCSNACKVDCPPDEPIEACSDWNLFYNSYTSARMKQGFDTFKGSGLRLSCPFVTPHYNASDKQRSVIEGWSGILFENYMDDPKYRNLTIVDTDTPFYRGAVYIPTPLNFVRGSCPDKDVERMCNSIQSYKGQEIAGFYYHPYLEFPFIKITESGYEYDDNSYLKRLVRCFKQQGFKFVSIENIVYFAPGKRQTGFFPGSEYTFFTGDVNGDGKTDFIIWQRQTGSWYFALSGLEDFPDRQSGGFSRHLALKNWAVGSAWQPFTGDFNGDGETDAAAWNPGVGEWQVALNNGQSLIPQGVWLKAWPTGDGWIPLVGDFNGDGRDDIIACNRASGEWQAALCSGSGFIPQGPWLKSRPMEEHHIPLVGDFNGDGRDDIIVWDCLKGEWQVALSDGSRLVPAGTWLTKWSAGTNWTPLIGDFNGDGKDDIIVVDVSEGDWQIAQSTGDKFLLSSAPPFKPWSADPKMQPFAGCFNGSKKACICARHPDLRNGTIDIAVSIFDTVS